jgi:hypothetical protein
VRDERNMGVYPFNLSILSTHRTAIVHAFTNSTAHRPTVCESCDTHILQPEACVEDTISHDHATGQAYFGVQAYSFPHTARFDKAGQASKSSVWYEACDRNRVSLAL